MKRIYVTTAPSWGFGMWGGEGRGAWLTCSCTSVVSRGDGAKVAHAGDCPGPHEVHGISGGLNPTTVWALVGGWPAERSEKGLGAGGAKN